MDLIDTPLSLCMLGGMTEEAKPAASAPTTPQETAPSPQAPAFASQQGPVVWCKGGTTTSRYDAEVARQHFDAEQRRKELDEDKRTVREEGAKMFSHQFADALDEKVLLLFDDTKLGVRMEMLCELLQEESDQTYTLIMCCPDCIARGIPADAAQMRVSSLNRRWAIDTRNRGKLGHYTDAWGRRQVFLRAGSITDTDILRCSGAFCTFACRIDNDLIRRV